MDKYICTEDGMEIFEDGDWCKTDEVDKYIKPKGKDGCRADSKETKELRKRVKLQLRRIEILDHKNKMLKENLEDALTESRKYFDCSYREAIKGE